VFVQGEGLL